MGLPVMAREASTERGVLPSAATPVIDSSEPPSYKEIDNIGGPTSASSLSAPKPKGPSTLGKNSGYISVR